MFWIILIGYIFVLLGTLIFTVTRSWIYALSAFSLQTLGVGLLALQIAPLPIAAAKCIVGWLAVTILAVTISREKKGFFERCEGVNRPIVSHGDVDFVASSMIVLFSGLGGFFQNPPVGILLPSGFLLGIGLVNLGISEHPLRVALSFLALLQGFELSYLWVEQSLLVLALLAVMDLSILVVLSILHSYAAPMESIENWR